MMHGEVVLDRALSVMSLTHAKARMIPTGEVDYGCGDNSAAAL